MIDGSPDRLITIPARTHAGLVPTTVDCSHDDLTLLIPVPTYLIPQLLVTYIQTPDSTGRLPIESQTRTRTLLTDTFPTIADSHGPCYP